MIQVHRQPGFRATKRTRLRRPFGIHDLVSAVVALALIVGTPTISRSADASSTAGAMRGIPVMFAPRTLFHTLTSDFFKQPDGTIYVQTGDIPAMWLRDSAAQTLPYVRLAAVRPMLRTWIRAVILREARNINVDPYANAYRVNYRVWERKWEIDSLAYPAVLSWTYFNATHDRGIFTASLHAALGRIVDTYACERVHGAFVRHTCPSWAPGAPIVVPRPRSALSGPPFVPQMMRRATPTIFPSRCSR